MNEKARKEKRVTSGIHDPEGVSEKRKPQDLSPPAKPHWPLGLQLSTKKDVTCFIPEDLAVILSREAFEQLFGYAYSTASEICCLGTVKQEGERFRVERFYLVPQSGSLGHTELYEEAVAALVEALITQGKAEGARFITCPAHAYSGMGVVARMAEPPCFVVDRQGVAWYHSCPLGMIRHHLKRRRRRRGTMIVGVAKEIKADEYRVGIIPAGVEALVRHGHTVLVEKEAGVGSGIDDAEYVQAGAEIVASPKDVYGRAELIIKVKEPLPQEHPLLRAEQMLFTYFHFATSRELTEAIVDCGCAAIAYETVRTVDGLHPLLTPMSEVAGRMSIQEGAKYLEKPMEGRGILLGGVPGVAPANVVIIGGGVVGTNAAKVAAGLRAQVTVLDVNLNRLRYLDDIMPKNVVLLMSDPVNIRQSLRQADLVIGAVLIEGARAPVLVSQDDLRLMQPGSVVVDVAIDQGGCIETSRPTTHSDPTYIVDGVLHYCVTNMPGAVGRTSTYALCNATLPYALQLAEKGYQQAAAENPALEHGINVAKGVVTNQAVADTFGLPCEPLR